MLTQNGIVCQTGDMRISLDPKKAQHGLNFVSHAHSDHLPSKNGGIILSSMETGMISKLRGFTMENHVTEVDGVSLYDTGHVLGARGILFDGICYTGDICTRKRGFLQGGRIPKCKVLITECTFGLPKFQFPPITQVQKQVDEIIAGAYSKGIPVILMGYQLGKSQTITHLFGHWDPLYLHDSVKQMNDLHKSLGVDLKESMGHTDAERAGLLDRKPWVMIAPLMTQKNPFVKHMKAKYGALTIGFSGWNIHSGGFMRRRCDYMVPLSDHCDFNELVEMVVRSGAQKVYTVHGYIDEFAAYLRKQGIDAQPLRKDTMDNFV